MPPEEFNTEDEPVVEESAVARGGHKKVPLDVIREKYFIGTGRDLGSYADNRIPFGLPYLDYVTSGGVKQGCITLITGEAYSGKSTMALLVAGHAERPAYVDTEGSLSREIMEIRSASHAEVYTAGDLQAVFEIAEGLLSSGDYDLIVLDSPSSCYMRPVNKDGTALPDSPVDEPPIGLGARYFSHFVKRLTALLRRPSGRNTAIVIVQHERPDITPGTFGPVKRVLSMGRTQLYAADLHIQCQGEKIYSQAQVFTGGLDAKQGTAKALVGLRCHWTLLKGRLMANAEPVGSFVIRVTSLEDVPAGALQLFEEKFRYLKAIGQLNLTGAYYIVGDKKLHGSTALREYLDEHWDEILANIRGLEQGN